MRRGELYRVQHPRRTDPKRSRVFVIVSRQTVIDSRFSTVVCAPVYSRRDGLSSQVDVGPTEGLKHESSIHCDPGARLRHSRDGESPSVSTRDGGSPRSCCFLIQPRHPSVLPDP
jgi:mRNA interferase MazF